MGLNIFLVKLGCWQRVLFLRVTRVFNSVVEKGLVRVPHPCLVESLQFRDLSEKTYCLQSDINYLITESEGESQIESSP